MGPRQLERSRDQVQLVDVREPEEWHAGRIPGSHWVPMNDLPGRLGELATNRKVVTVCRHGNRSGQMAERLRNRGFDAENLDGGIAAWAEQNLPVQEPDNERPGKVA